MSDLQISLLVIGALMIIAVIVYNRIQENRFRRRAEQSFGQQRADVLLRDEQPEAQETRRIEPQLLRSPEDSELSTLRREPRTTQRRPSPVVELPLEDTGPQVDYVAEVRSSEPIAGAQIAQLRSQMGELLGRVQILYWEEKTGSWIPVDVDGAMRPSRLRLAMQLANRKGPVRSEHLLAFQSTVREWAHNLSASAEVPDASRFASLAGELDKFCTDVDVVVGINVVAARGSVFPGSKIRTLAEAAGFRTQENGEFYFPGNHGEALFTLENLEPHTLTAGTARSLTTSGITLALDVPRQRDGLASFDQMVAIGQSLADALGGTLVDDNRVVVASAGLQQIRGQLRSIYSAMETRGIDPGSPLAQRLFS